MDALSAAEQSGRDAFVRGVELLRQERFEDAVRELQTAAHALPSYAPLHNALGIALTKVGRSAEANNSYRRAIAIDPRFADAHKNLAFNRWTAGKFTEAEQSFRQALKLNTNDEFAIYGLGTVLHAQGRYAEAVPLLESTVKSRPMDAGMAYLLATTYEKLGRLPLALETYERAVRLDPANEDRYLDYTRLLLDLDRYDESIRVAQTALKKVQDGYALYLRLGAAELMKGNTEAAEISFREAIQAHAEIPLGYVALAKVFIKNGREQEAVDFLDGVRKKLAPDFLVEYFLGFALERLGRDAEALESFSRASSLGPNVPDVHVRLGKLLLKTGQTDAAKSELEEAIRLGPNNSGAFYQLSRVYAKKGDLVNARKFSARVVELRKQQVTKPALVAGIDE